MDFQLRHGINIGRWLCHGNASIQERAEWLRREDVHKIRDMGFDHIRICLKEQYFWDEQGNQDPFAFDVLKQGINWAMDSGLNVSVNLHILRSHFFNDLEEPLLFHSEQAQEDFLGMWEQLAAHLGGYSNARLAYEYLNEPVARDDNQWNAVHMKAYRALRTLEAERPLILGSNLWNQTRTFHHLEVPDDENMILDFHFYEPLLVTHYHAPWVPKAMVPWRVHYPGKPLRLPAWVYGLWVNLTPGSSEIHRRDAWHENVVFNKDVLLQTIEPALEVAKAHHMPLNCGEFGLYHLAQIEPGYRWLRDLLSIFSEQDISWTIWCLGKGDDGFAILGENQKENPIATVLKSFM